MAYSFTAFDARTKEIVEWLVKEYTAVRTGRATPALLDSVQVESYGARVPLMQVGSVGVEDSRTLRISAWDAAQVKAIEKAITDADLGVSVTTDDRGIRVTFPELTSERRTQLLKIAKAKLEDARVSLRAARDEVVRELEQKEKASELTEDEKFRAKGDLQKRMDKANEQLDALLTKKETEISQ